MLDRVNSIYILEEILVNLKNKRKLNIIKYNKRIMAKLNINKKDYKVYKLLKEFNKKYFYAIEDIDIKELILKERDISNKVLKDLVKIKFKELNIKYKFIRESKF